MDKKYLNTLEFPLILGRLARNVSFSAGKELALSLAPSPVFVEVQQRLQETREARYLLDAHGGISIGGAHAAILALAVAGCAMPTWRGRLRRWIVF